MNTTVVLGLALVACFGTFQALRGGWTSPRKTTIIGLDPKGLGISALAVIAAVIFFGPLFGLALILVVMIHEFGHVAAFRVAGHHDASFRLVPLLGGYAISNRQPATPEESVFITLMGPAICLAPMLLAYALVPLVATTLPQAVSPLLVFASICGALNFFNLLPIWPLDGGRLTASLLPVFHERLPFYVFAVSTALIGLVALLTQSLFMVIFVAMGVQHLMQSGGRDGRAPYQRMSRKRAWLCLGAWLFTAAALFMGGLGIVLNLL